MGYQYSARERQQIKRQNAQAALKDRQGAQQVRVKTANDVAAIREKGQAQIAAAAKDASAPYRDEVKRLISQPVTQWTGGPGETLVVKHWRTPPITRWGEQNAEPGPLVRLTRGQRPIREKALIEKSAPTLLSTPDGAEWAKAADAAVDEVKKRYPILPRLADRDFVAGLLDAAGITTRDTDKKTRQTAYGPMDQTITTVQVPVLSEVTIDQDGLVLRFAHRTGDSAAEWASGRRLDALKSAFSAGGVDASRLRVVPGHDGSIVLHFDDAPSAFPKAVAPPVTEPVESVEEAKRRYRDFRWLLGVDARGNVIAPSIREVYHVLVVGDTGSGKSVWIRGLIESARLAGFRVYLGDGKLSDYPALENAPGVVMRSSDPPQHIVLVAEIHDEMVRRQEVAEKRKREAHPDPFDFEPILLVLDEFASMRGDVFKFVGGQKSAMEPWLTAIAAISRKGRELKVHLVLASQDLYVENIPNQWQGNFQLLVSLGEVEDKTLDTKFIPDTLKEDAKRIGSRITRKDRGRGLFVDKANPPVVKITEFQSFYSYSPGSTSLEAEAPPDVSPPTKEVRGVWEQQRDAAEQMPRLYPRIGIKVESPGWTNAKVSELMKVPTVALDDRDGNPIPSMVRYDHRTAEWLGREQVSMTTRRGSAMAHGEEDEVESPSSAPSAEPVTEMTAEEKEAEIRRIARARGWLKDEDAADQDRLNQLIDNADKGTPNPLADTVNDDDSIGDF